MNRVVYDQNDKIYINDTSLVVISQDNQGVIDIPYVKEKGSEFEIMNCTIPGKYCEVPYYFPTAHRITDR